MTRGQATGAKRRRASRGGASARTESANITLAPQVLAAEARALEAMFNGSVASAQALSFYRIPLFLLPIYQAAAVQYGVPWEILAAINEVETDYGADLSVSSAGAVGWMQFMPATWLQYGVDALNSGYADPYNPVDAVFAAARYLHAAGASKDLRGAVFAYNHSNAYVESVLLRARLIASYPPPVIATLTGLSDGTAPVRGASLSAVAPRAVVPPPVSPSSATVSPALIQPAGATPASRRKQPSAALSGAPLAPSPTVSAAAAERAIDAAAPPSQLSRLRGPLGAPVVAVKDGRVVSIGVSRRLGHYVVLRDTYGDVFTYAGLGSIAPGYRLGKPAPLQVPKGALDEGQTGSDPKPTQAAAAGHQPPVTLHVAVAKRDTNGPIAANRVSRARVVSQRAPVLAAALGAGNVFAPIDGTDAVGAARARAAHRTRNTGQRKLERGSVVTQGTVLGHLVKSGVGPYATLRFAIRPSGASSAIDPRTVLENWKQLNDVLHPQGAKDPTVLAGATASDAFGMSADELKRAVLSDPGITLGACESRQVIFGKVDSRVLALLVFLSRSGLKPTVAGLGCGHTVHIAYGSVYGLHSGDSFDITAVSGVPISGHQGAGTITDTTIRTLLAARGWFAPKRIVSLMRYPGASSTVAKPDHGTYIEVDLPKRVSKGVAPRSSAAPPEWGVAGSPLPTGAGRGSSTSLATSTSLSSTEWQRLIERIGALPSPKVSRKPSSAAIPDQAAVPGNPVPGNPVPGNPVPGTRVP